jgi:hypothetical protein
MKLFYTSFHISAWKKQTNNWYKQDQASPCSFAKKMYCCYWIRMFSMRYDKHRNVCRDCLSPRLSVVSSSWSPGYSESFQRVKQRQLLRQLRQLHQLGTARSSCRCLDSPRRQRKCAPGGGVKVSRISGFLGDSDISGESPRSITKIYQTIFKHS